MFAPAFSAAQDHGEHPATSDQPAIFKAETRLVVLHASVADKNGKLLTNLPEKAFKVYENGAEQTIKDFRREDVPVSLGLVIDNSGSMRDKRAKVERAALQAHAKGATGIVEVVTDRDQPAEQRRLISVAVDAPTARGQGGTFH